MRMTRQRKLLLTIIEAAESPLSAEEIASRARLSDPSLALSTVYRNLEKMELLGLCLKTRFQDGLARFEPAGRSHHHFLICTGCGCRQVVELCPLHAIQKQLEMATGYQITDHQINLYGLCPSCQRR